MPQNPNRSADEQDTAYHEAGHAVVGAVCGRPPISVTVIRDGDVAGKNEFPKDWRPEFQNHSGDFPEKRAYIETRILTEVAGTIALDLRFPERAHDAADAFDERCARAIMEENAGWADGNRDSYFQQLREIARGLLQTNWPWVEAVVLALIERKIILTAEIMELRPSE
jgi:hypothetical protein